MKKRQHFPRLILLAFSAIALASYFYVLSLDRQGAGVEVPDSVKQINTTAHGIAGAPAPGYAVLAQPKTAPLKNVVLPIPGGGSGNLKYEKTIIRDLEGVTRVREIELSPELRNGELEKFSKGDKLEFALFDDARFAGNIERTGRNVNGTAALSGKLDNEIYSSFATASTGGVFAAEFSIPRTGMDYAIYPRDGKYYVFEFRHLDRGALENGDTKAPPPLPPGFAMNEAVSRKLGTATPSSASSSPPVPVGDTTSLTQIDVLVAYTASANSYAVTNHESMANAISLMMTKSQACLDNSNINITWNLVYSYQTDYTELNSSQDLNNFTFSASYNPWNYEGTTKYMEEVHTYRATYAADVCTLLENINYTGGQGWQLDVPAGQKELAFHIARVQQVTWTSTDIHESGHNMGAHHSKTQASQPSQVGGLYKGLYSYSSGWQWASSPKPDGYTVGYCTLMTYENFDNNLGNGNEYRNIDSFSDPNLSPAEGGGYPSGTATDNNARCIREIKDVIAAYYSPPGFTLSKSTSTVLENGGTDTFTVVLSAQPASNVVFSVTSSAPGEATVTPITLTFTPANWNNPQTVTITGVNDTSLGNDVATVTVSVVDASSDNNWDPLADKTIAVTCTNDDTAGFIISAISGNTTEAGGTATFTIRLASQPTANVTIGLSSNDTTEGTVSPASLTFASGNWNVNQTVTVTGVDDSLVDGNVAYIIVTAPASSADPNYNGLNPSDVSVTNVDNDVAGVAISGISGNTTEAGGTATFTVRLTSQPTANVTIALSSNDTTEGTVNPTSLTFTSGNWNINQTVTVTGVDDSLVDGNVAYIIVTAPASSADPSYNGLNPVDVSVTNIDNDFAGFTLSKSISTVSENGGTDTFTVVLSAQPDSNVVLSVTSSATNQATVAPATLTFTPAIWNNAQTVTITGANDNTVSNDSATVTVSVVDASSDNKWDPLADKTVAVTCTNDDYTLTVNNDGNGTTVPSGASVQTKGVAAAITANFGTGYHFLNWTVTSGSASFANANSASTTVTASADATIRANFAIDIHTLTYLAGAHGSISGIAVQTRDYGTNGTPVTAVPAPNYYFTGWSDGLKTLTRSETNVTADATFTASFHDNVLTVPSSIYGLSDSAGGQKKFIIKLPAGQKFLKVELKNVAGDCDLYLKCGSEPTIQLYNYKSTNGANMNESITVLNPSSDMDWYIMLYAYGIYSEATLSVNYGTDWIGKPTGLIAFAGTPADKQVSLNWDAVVGALSYEIFRGDVDDILLATKINSLEVTDVSYNDTFAVSGTYHYYYWVRAVDGSENKGEFSDPVYFFGQGKEGFAVSSSSFQNGRPIPAKFANVGITGGQNISPRLSWENAPDGTKSFAVTCIDTHPAAKKFVHWMVIDIPAGSTVLTEGASPAGMPGGSKELQNSFGSQGYGGPEPPEGIVHTYVFTVYALNAASISTSGPLSETNFLNLISGKVLGKTQLSGTFLKYSKVPAAPAGVNASDGLFDDRIVVTWTAAVGATSYVVGRKNNLADANFAEEFETSDTIFEDNSKTVLDAAPGTLFHYFVIGKNLAGSGKAGTGNSGYLSKAPSAPGTVTASDGTYFGKIRVSWTKLSGATSYRVFRTENALSAPNPVTDEPIGETGALYLDDFGDDIVPQIGGVVKKYYYWIAAKNRSGTTVISKSNDGSLSKKGPATVSASNGTYSNRVVVTWSEVPGATAYDVYRYTDPKFTQNMKPVGNAVAALEFEDSEVTPNTLFYYKVKAKYENHYDSDFSIAGASGKASGASNPVATAIANGATSPNMVGKIKDNSMYFSIDVPAGTTRLIAALNGTSSLTASNDCDIFAKFANYPTKTSFNAKGVENNTNEVLTVSNPAAGTWYFLLYGTTAYTNVTLTVTSYAVADIVLTQVPVNDLVVPFTAAFKGKIVDETGTGIPNIVIQARNPITRLTSSLTKTDAKGIFTYSALINSGGEHTFDFFFTDIPDTAKGTASHTVATRKGALEANNFFDFSGYLPATPVPVPIQADIVGLQKFLDIRNGWDDTGTVSPGSPYETLWVNSTLTRAENDAQLYGKLDEGLYMFFYGVEGAGVGNDMTVTSSLSAVPLVVHVAADERDVVLDNLKELGVIDSTQYDDIKVKGKIGVVAVAALRNTAEGAIDGDRNISLLAREQLEVLANIAAGAAGIVEPGKYSDVTVSVAALTLASGRTISVVSTAFIK